MTPVSRIKLSRIPKSALVKFLIGAKPSINVLREAFKDWGDSQVLTESNLYSLSLSQLLSLAERCNSVTDAMVDRLFEEYRYRGMKTFYLYEIMNSNGVAAPTTEEFQALNQFLTSEMASNPIRGTTKVQVSNDVEKVSAALNEFSYDYVARVPYTDPDTEEPKTISDLRRGFIWLDQGAKWLSICAKDEAVATLLAKGLEQKCHLTLRKLPITKTMILRIEPPSNLRRAALVDSTTRTKRRYTNPELSSDSTAMEEVRRRDLTDDRPSSGYNQSLNDQTEFALGYQELGKIFLSKDLAVAQLRDWVPERIALILRTFRGLAAGIDLTALETLALTKFPSYPSKKRDVIARLASAIQACQDQNLHDCELDLTAGELRAILGPKLIVSVIEVNCEECQEPADLRCSSCQSGHIVHTDSHLSCSNCQVSVELANIECFQGHRNRADSIENLITLLPTVGLKQDVDSLLRASGMVSPERARFTLRGPRLSFHRPDTEVLLFPEDIPELSVLYDRTVIDATRQKQIESALLKFKEKFKCMSISNCSTCVVQRHGSPCLLRLLGLFDPTYTPRPHQGHEFGDYSRMVTVSGEQLTLALVMKSYNRAQKGPVKLRDPVGQDIYTQFGHYRGDGRVQVIGICLPHDLEEGFRARLIEDARQSHKKLVFFEKEGLKRLIHSAAARQNVGIGDL